MNDSAKTVMVRLERLGRISEEPNRLTRTFCSPAMRQANDVTARWMREAGMQVREDAIGNLIGHYAAATPTDKFQRRAAAPKSEPKILLLGSHLDTVRNAGKFDGPLGVLLAIACIEQLHRAGIRLPFAIEVLGFADEEGVRYQCAYLGSRVLAGTFTAADLSRRDAGGVTMAEAIRRFGSPASKSARTVGALRSALKQARLAPDRLLGYVEAHIEQGPVLEQRKLAVGIVSAIAGQSRFEIAFVGRAGHAGTTPPLARRDALCAAAQFILAVEKVAHKTSGLVATVGQIQVEPNVSNVIPGAVTLTLDLRHQKDFVRRSAAGHLLKLARRAGSTRGVKVAAQLIQQTRAVPCSRGLSLLLKRAARRHQPEVITLPSGAGHDAAVLATITPVAMLFIRCKGGVSHHPDESVSFQDVRLALSVMGDFLRLLGTASKIPKLGSRKPA